MFIDTCHVEVNVIQELQNIIIVTRIECFTDAEDRILVFSIYSVYSITEGKMGIACKMAAWRCPIYGSSLEFTVPQCAQLFL